MFWQPPLKEGEDVDPEKVEFLPLGFDEFYGKGVTEKKENIWMRLVSGLENGLKSRLENFEKWAEEKKKDSEMKKELIEKELELIEAEICLEEAIEDMEEELKRKEKEEEEKVEMGLLDEDASTTKQDKKASVEEEGEEEDDEDDDVDDAPPSSFGSASANQDPSKDQKPRDSPFSTASLHFASSTLVSGVSSFPVFLLSTISSIMTVFLQPCFAGSIQTDSIHIALDQGQINIEGIAFLGSQPQLLLRIIPFSLFPKDAKLKGKLEGHCTIKIPEKIQNPPNSKEIAAASQS